MDLRHLGLASFAFLVGCGGGGSGTTTQSASSQGRDNGTASSFSVTGAVQKGPFLVGSTVLVNKLTEVGLPTESTLTTQIADSVGNFSFTTSSAGPVQITANGYYFSELTGAVSSGTVTLRAIYEVDSAARQTAFVNVMTHLINNRVLALMGNQRLSVRTAVAQAEREFLNAFSTALRVDGLDQFSGLSLYNTANSTNAAGNAYLLALSTGFYKFASIRAQQQGTAADAELTLILNQIAADLADDGQIQNPTFMADFIRAIRSLSPIEIVANLRRRSTVDFPAGIEVADMSRFLSVCAGNAECSWRYGAPLDKPTRGLAVAQFGGKLYSFGGTDAGTDSTAWRAVRMYDPATNAWSSKQPMPVDAYDIVAHTIGDRIFVLPGYGSNGFRNEVFEYNPRTDAWTQKKSSPTYRYEVASAVLNGRIYMMGGEGTIDDGPWESGKAWAFKSHVAIYDPATDTWSTGQSLPTPVAGAASCSAGDEIFVFGGRGSAGELVSSTLVYNASSNSWSTRSPLPAPREGHDCVAVGNQFYVLGGRRNGALDSVDRYDPQTDSWSSPTRLPVPRYWFDADAIGGEIFLVGGQNASELASVEILNPLH